MFLKTIRRLPQRQKQFPIIQPIQTIHRTNILIIFLQHTPRSPQKSIHFFNIILLIPLVDNRVDYCLRSFKVADVDFINHVDLLLGHNTYRGIDFLEFFNFIPDF
jgi:hypothetical protein